MISKNPSLSEKTGLALNVLVIRHRAFWSQKYPVKEELKSKTGFLDC